MLRKTLFVIMSTIAFWFTLFVICIDICKNNQHCNGIWNACMACMHSTHACTVAYMQVCMPCMVHGAQGEGVGRRMQVAGRACCMARREKGWAPEHMHAGTRGKDVF